MLSSLLPNNLGFIRVTRCALTSTRVGKNRLPLVNRLATNISPLEVVSGMADLIVSRIDLRWMG
jgi:hypothetical protein